MTPKRLFLLSLFATSPVWANSPPPPNVAQKLAERAEDQRLQSQQAEQAPANVAKQAAANAQTAQTGKRTLSITKEELAKQPELVIRALIPALAQNNAETVALIYPIYQKIPAEFHAPLFDEWSQAILAREQQHYRQAIQHYRNVIAEYPDQNIARFQLAQALFENNELEAAEDQFQKLRSEANLDEQSKAVIDRYLSAIAQQDSWDFSGGLTYLNDPNINNAPKAGTTIGNWQAPEAESAQGVGFDFNVGKKWSWGNGFYNELRLDLDGKYYWDNKKYNEASARGSLGIGYKNANFNLAVLPFLSQTLYAGGSNASDTLKRFSKSGGVGVESAYWLNPQWRASGYVEYGEQRYTQRQHLNGNYYYTAATLTHYANAQRYWLVGADFNRTRTRDKDDSFHRTSLRAGWGQEWQWGLSTYLGVSYAWKNYRAPMPIFSITQRNKELGITASLWHRAVQFKGITPRLTLSYTKVNSNHAFYSYDKARVFLEITKRF